MEQPKRPHSPLFVLINNIVRHILGLLTWCGTEKC